MNLALAVIFAILGSVGSVVGAAGILLLASRTRRVVDPLVSYATGTLLGASFMAMLPAALERESTRPIFGTVLAALIGFFVLERLMIWRHRHPGRHHTLNVSGEMILVGDAIHNLMDGFAIGASFAEGGSLGLTTALAIIAHEVAQEVGDFAILLDSGLTRRRALVCNVISSSTTILAAAVAYAAASVTGSLIPYVLAVAAASFLYIALADLVPRHHARWRPVDLPREVLLILAGITTILALQLVA